MERGDIIRMAREAGFREYLIQDSLSAELERFAALVAAHEREACEQIAMSEASSGSSYGWPECAYVIAKAIRARGEK